MSSTQRGRLPGSKGKLLIGFLKKPATKFLRKPVAKDLRTPEIRIPRRAVIKYPSNTQAPRERCHQVSREEGRQGPKESRRRRRVEEDEEMGDNDDDPGGVRDCLEVELASLPGPLLELRCSLL